MISPNKNNLIRKNKLQDVKAKLSTVFTNPLGNINIPAPPPNKMVKDFFNKIGNAIEISNENLSLNFWTTSSMMAPFYEILNQLSSWLVQKGIKKKDAQNYITSLFLALAEDAYKKSCDLKKLVNESQTPKGLNEQSLKELKKMGFYNSLHKTSEVILKRLKKK